MHQRPIYLDYMATTPVDPRVASLMMQYLGPEACFGNPASTSHLYGRQAAIAVEKARAQIAQALHADPSEIVFTSGATEANNLAILGAARFYQRKGRHLITLATEHKAVLDSFHELEREGFRVTILTPNADGLLSLVDLANALTPETILVSIMQVNNEIGVIQDIAAIAALLRDKGIIFHVDAAQSLGKIPIDLSLLAVDLMSFSAHKVYGPKGVGALYLRRKPRVRLLPQSFGGGHEGGLRSGTLATHQIVGMGEAVFLAHTELSAESLRLKILRDRLWAGILHLKGVSLNGHLDCRVAHNLNVTFAGIEGSSLLLALRELAVSTTSACASASGQASYVLRALGRTTDEAYSSIRFSLGRFTTDDEISRAIEIICTQVQRLREMSLI